MPPTENQKVALNLIEIALVGVGSLAANPEAKAQKTIRQINQVLRDAYLELGKEKHPGWKSVLELIYEGSNLLAKRGAPGASEAHKALTKAVRALKE
jgi:hypothetical protein